MKTVYRVVENQANLSSYRATQTQEKATQLEILIDLSKPKLLFSDWHELVATPFRYPLPVMPQYQARFRPPFSNRNIFYSSGSFQTALFEYSYHFMRQRAHLLVGKKKKNEIGVRTGFSVDTDDSGSCDISGLNDVQKIMDPFDYSSSHHYILEHPEQDYLIYPSVRDPSRGKNVAILNILKIDKNINQERQLKFFYNYRNKELHWLSAEISISWKIFSEEKAA